jgi:P-type E1-E2 ATPase
MPTMSGAQTPSTNETGLSESEVRLRIARGEVNRVASSGWAASREILARHVLTLFNLLVAPAAIALIGLGDWRAGWAVSGIAVLNTAIGLVQEFRAKRWLDQLTLLAEPMVRVRRQGQTVSIRSGEVVRGDVLLLSAGEPIVADGPVLAAQALEVDESLLTGESDPVAKSPDDLVLSGSLAVAGLAVYRADRVGSEAFAHRLTLEARRYRHLLSPMQRAINRLIQVLTAVTLILSLFYAALFAAGRMTTEDLWRMIAATVTSMVPQGLVLMTTVVLTLSAVRLSRRGAIVQRLAAVESMAAVDILCLDKTGTLTTGQLHLERVVPLAASREEVLSSLQWFAWASIDNNKTIEAIRTAFARPIEPFEVVEQVPFKSKTRTSALTLRVGVIQRTLVLGAVEAILPSLRESEPVREAWERLRTTGLRVLLLAESPQRASQLGDVGREHSARALGLIALADRWRPGAGRVLSELAEEGIRFKILSGDHPDTVRAAVAPIAPLLNDGAVATGQDLATSEDRGELIRRTAIFGRVDPQQKREILRELQCQGHHVGMVGDGVNDLLVIKQADLGVAMGSGTSAARKVADLVLVDDDMSLLLQTLREGRTIVHKVRRVARLFLTKNVYTLILILGGFGFLAGEFPYLPQQVTLLNALTIGMPSLLLLSDRTERRVPRHPSLLRSAGIFALGSGGAIGLCAFGLWFVAASWGADLTTRRTLLLTTLIFCGLGNAWVISQGQLGVRLWCPMALAIYLAAMYTPFLADFFALAPLPHTIWRQLLIVSATAMVLGFLLDRSIPGSCRGETPGDAINQRGRRKSTTKGK